MSLQELLSVKINQDCAKYIFFKYFNDTNDIYEHVKKNNIELVKYMFLMDVKYKTFYKKSSYDINTIIDYTKALTEAHHGLPQVGEGLRDGTSLIYTIIDYTAGFNNLILIQWLKDNGCIYTYSAFINASINGHLDVLKWLVNDGAIDPYDIEKIQKPPLMRKLYITAVDHAAKNGHLNVVEWFYSLNFKITSNSVIYIIQNNQLDILKFMKNNGHEFNNNDLFNVIRCKGSLELFKFIHENVSKIDNKALTDKGLECPLDPFLARHGLPQVGEGLALRARDEIARDGKSFMHVLDNKIIQDLIMYGRLDILKYSLDKGYDMTDYYLLILSSFCDNLQIFKWLHDNGCKLTIDCLSITNNVDIIKYIRENGFEWDSSIIKTLILKSISKNNIEMLKYIRENDGDWDSSITEDILLKSIEYNKLEMIKYIRECGGDWPIDAADLAASFGHLKVLKYIRENGGEWSSDAADDAAGNGHLEVLKWIRENGGEWTSNAGDYAAGNGHLEVLKYIHENGGKLTLLAVSYAVIDDRLDIIDWMKENGYTRYVNLALLGKNTRQLYL